MAISKTLRFEVFKRDSFRCVYCGRTPPTVILECDHVIAASAGGSNEIENLATSCFDCNRGKAARDLNSLPDTLADTMAKRQELRDQVEQYNQFQKEVRASEDAAIKRIGSFWYKHFSHSTRRFDETRIPSLRRFLRSMTESEIMEAAEIALMRKPTKFGRDDDTFKYFCGICWKIIKQEC